VRKCESAKVREWGRLGRVSSGRVPLGTAWRAPSARLGSHLPPKNLGEVELRSRVRTPRTVIPRESWTARAAADLVPGRVNPRLEKRKAPQTTWGFSIRAPQSVIPRERCTALSHTQSSARDRGIYSLLLVAFRRVRYLRLQSAQADIAFSQPRIHSPGDAARAPVARRVRYARPQSTKVDFAPFQRRIHSLLEVDCASVPGEAVRTGARRRAPLSHSRTFALSHSAKRPRTRAEARP
jgi:hypothetical protein